MMYIELSDVVDQSPADGKCQDDEEPLDDKGFEPINKINNEVCC